MPKQVIRELKKPYSAPALIIYGTVQQLPKAVGLLGSRDGGSNRMKFKTRM
jgi:hypothetical protein